MEALVAKTWVRVNSRKTNSWAILRSITSSHTYIMAFMEVEHIFIMKETISGLLDCYTVH